MSKYCGKSILPLPLIVVLAELGKTKLGVVLKHPSDSPFAGEDKQVLAPKVLNPLGIVRKAQSLGIKVLVLDPSDLAITHIGTAKITAVLILKTVFKYLELKHTYNAYDNSLKTRIRLKEDLNSTLLGDLVHTLGKLLTLHGVNLLYHSKMLGSEGGNTLESDLLSLLANGVADREDARIEYTDNIACVGLVNNLTLGCHHLLRLRETEGLVALHMVVILATLKLTRANTHKCNTVTVCLVHIRLDLEYEGREILVKRIYSIALCHSGKG